jgi:hypothetical protein
MVTREEQRKAEERKARDRFENRDGGGFNGRRVLDLSSIGGYKKELFWKPKEGLNKIDIVPFVAKTNNIPGTKAGFTDFVLDVYVHRNVGPKKDSFVCPARTYGKACPICEERDELRGDSNADEEKLEALRPKQRVFYNVIDLMKKDSPVQIFEEVYYFFDRFVQELAGIDKNAFVTYWTLKGGMTLQFTAKEKKGKYKGFEYFNFSFAPRADYSEAIMTEAHDFSTLLHVPSYEEIRNSHYSCDDVEESAPVGAASTFAHHSEHHSEEVPGRRRRPVAEEAPVNPCPFGHNFGVDTDQYVKEGDCNKCEESVYNACYDKKTGV